MVKCQVGNNDKYGLQESTIQALGVTIALTVSKVAEVSRSIFMHHLTWTERSLALKKKKP